MAIHIASRLAALASVVLLSLTACGGSDKPNDPPPPAQLSLGTVKGVVADVQTGEPITGVEVKIGGLAATSDASGKFSIANVPVGAGVVAQFTKPEYASNFATLEVGKDKVSVANRSMAKVAVKQDINAALGGTVTLAGSPAQVQLPAAGLVNAASGAAYNGTVTVEMTPIDAGRNPLIMPGNYRAQGEAVPIESMGALQVEMRDSSGALLNLAPGKTAAIRIPVPATTTSPPLTIPLYYFKESTGLWVREGTATLAGNPPQQYYEGTVSHFTVWNADQPLDTIYINGCVVDKNNRPLDATVTSMGLDYNGMASVQTLPGGLFKVPARRNSRVQVSADNGDFSTSMNVTTGSVDLTLPTCLVIDQKPPVILTQPLNLTVAPGAFATLQVVASNAKQYKWYRNGTLIAGGSRVLPLIGGEGVAGSYYVVVSNEQGAVTSDTVTVVVAAAAILPNLTGQPQDSSVVAGSGATFVVQAQGESLSYQWQRNGIDIAAARGPSLNLGSTAMGDDGALFTCRVTNNAGSVLSNAARLTVTAAAIAPGFVQHPSNVSIGVGERASFSVTTSGTTPLTYQWLLNGNPIAGAVGATYQTPVAGLLDNGSQFSVRISNIKGSATSNSATLTVSAAATVPGLYLSFAQGVTFNGEFNIAAIPAGGGTASSFLAAGQGNISDFLIQGQVTDGRISNVHQRGYLYWKNDQLFRRDLVGMTGLPAEVRVSSATAAGVCNLDVSSSPNFVASGSDFNDVNRSWKIIQKAGTDTTCHTADDRFSAVHATMSASTAPLEVARPVATLHGADGSLSGWVVRNGQQIQRLSADFQNPVTLFTLTASDLKFYAQDNGKNAWIYTSGSNVYAVDLSASAPVVPSLIATLGVEESVADVAGTSQNDLIVAIAGVETTRILRFTPTNKSTVSLGLVDGASDLVTVTPTRVILRGAPGSLVSLPLSGGTPLPIYSPTTPRFAFINHRGGERIWQDMHNYVVSVNSDGTDVQILQGARIAGCILNLQTMLESTQSACDAIVVVDGNVVRSYDAQTGAVRVTYGTITPAAPPIVNTFSFSILTTWGQGGVLSQFATDPDSPVQQAVVNYYLKTDQPGMTTIVMP